MKDRAALYLIKEAEEKGEDRDDGVNVLYSTLNPQLSNPSRARNSTVAGHVSFSDHFPEMTNQISFFLDIEYDIVNVDKELAKNTK